MVPGRVRQAPSSESRHIDDFDDDERVLEGRR